MTLGEKLRSLRAISGWTQPECADKIGIEQSYLSKLENDKSIPSAEIFDALCATYQISPDEIIEGLDKAYVRKNLMHIPIVSASSNSQSRYIKTKRKKTIFVCAFLILIATLFFFISFLELISSNERFEYRSLGIDFKHEINQCSKSKDKGQCYYKYTGTNLEGAFNYGTHNSVPDSFITSDYQGKFIYKKLQKGFREYVVKRLTDKRTKINSILMILGVLMLASGILGLIIESRFYQIDKQ